MLLQIILLGVLNIIHTATFVCVKVEHLMLQIKSKHMMI